MTFVIVISVLGFGALFASLYMLRREGHRDIWEKLMGRYGAPDMPEEYPAFKESLYVLHNKRWIEWSEAWLMFAPEGIYFKQPVLVEWLAPGFLLPWQAIVESKVVETLHGDRLALNAEGVGYCVAIDMSHKDVIDQRGVGFSA